MKMQAPANIASFSIGGVEYSRGEDGLLDIPSDHVKAAVLLGAHPATPASPIPVDSEEDTSPPGGGISESGDKMADALNANPDFDNMSRDEMVEWLKGVGVVVPANTSKENARKAVEEAIADYRSGQKD